MKFKIGEKVKWRFQSQGVSVTKSGIVRGYIFRTSHIIETASGNLYLNEFKDTHSGVKTDCGINLISDRYLVEVHRFGRNKNPLVSHWYTPRSSSVDNYHPSFSTGDNDRIL